MTVENGENDDSADEIIIERRRADSENEEEEPIVVENEDEAEEVEEEIEVVDFPLESLHLYDDAFEWLLNSSTEYCFISVIGKSRFGKSLSQGRCLAQNL